MDEALMVESPEEIYLRHERNNKIIDVLQSLPAPKRSPQRDVLEMKFGLKQYDPMTYREIGEHYGISKARVEQIVSKHIKMCQHKSKRGILEPYIHG